MRGLAAAASAFGEALLAVGGWSAGAVSAVPFDAAWSCGLAASCVSSNALETSACAGRATDAAGGASLLAFSSGFEDASTTACWGWVAVETTDAGGNPDGDATAGNPDGDATAGNGAAACIAGLTTITPEIFAITPRIKPPMTTPAATFRTR